MGLIRRLSDDLINKIAAGEVVERPASVVKELAENAVDAHAKNVRVRLTQGGMGSIVIIDDGQGMTPEDARLAMERHATSKLRDEEGLFHILTKGFRGEALPSIASVSRFTLHTSVPGATSGVRLTVEGGGAVLVEDAEPAGGTRIDVNDLFFNVPARRKFLKRESTELGHCEEALIRLALAHPSVGFFLEHEGRLLFSSPASENDPKERLVAALGAEVAPHLLAIEEHRLGISVTGFVASSEFTLPNARGLYTFVNHRYVRDRGLTSSVQRAFQDSLPPGRQPVVAVHIELDPRAVDVNVHPQKLEVRFADPRSIQDAVIAAISRALKAAPWRQGGAEAAEAAAPFYAQAVDRFLARAMATPSFFAPEPSLDLNQQTGDRPAFGTARPDLNSAPPPSYFGALKFIGPLARRFWICEGPGGTLVIVDPVAVARRSALHALSERFHAGTLATATPTLFSATLTLPDAQRNAVLAQAEVLKTLGIEVEAFGGETIALRRVPVELEGADFVHLFDALLPKLPNDLEGALDVLSQFAADETFRDVTHDEVHRRLSALDELKFQSVPSRAKVVVFELPLLQLGTS